MGRMLRGRVVKRYVFDRISRADNLSRAVLAERRPHGQTGQEPAIPVFQFTKRIGHVAPGIKKNKVRALEF